MAEQAPMTMVAVGTVTPPPPPCGGPNCGYVELDLIHGADCPESEE